MLAFFFAVPRAPAADSPRVTYLKNALGEVPETSLPFGNTKDGSGALQNLTTGVWNSAFRDRALNHNTIGGANNAIGVKALFHNTQGTHNVANGVNALFANTTGIGNVGSGYGALYQNVNGFANTAFGSLAGINIAGDINVTLGAGAGINITTGNDNIALGTLAGSNVTTGNNNIHIGNDGVGGDSNTIRVGDLAVHNSVFLAGIVPMNPEAPNQAVLVDPSTGQLGMASVGSFPPVRKGLLVLLDQPDRQAVLPDLLDLLDQPDRRECRDRWEQQAQPDPPERQGRWAQLAQQGQPDPLAPRDKPVVWPPCYLIGTMVA